MRYLQDWYGDAALEYAAGVAAAARPARRPRGRPHRGHGPAAGAPAGLHRGPAHRAPRAPAGRHARRRRRPRRQDHVPRPRPAGGLPHREAALARARRRLRPPDRGGPDPRRCPTTALATGRVPGRSGVWLPESPGRPERKIAAIGIRVSRGVTMHGFSLNCDVDLGWYDRFVPCGIADAGVTSLDREIGRDVRPGRRGAHRDRAHLRRPADVAAVRALPRHRARRARRRPAAVTRRAACGHRRPAARRVGW